MALRKAARTNLWAFLIYPDDSAPDNYLEIIQNWHIPTIISPLHEPDNTGDIEERFKKHIHVLIYFGLGQKKSMEQVEEYSNQLYGTRPFMVESRNGYVRYLIHFDNPEKTQYEESDLLTFSGFEIGDAFRSYESDQEMYYYIEEIIKEHKFVNLADLIYFLKETNCHSEVKFIRSHTYYINCLLDGMYKRLKKQKKILDDLQDNHK